jgi:hypothetical protein
VQAMQQEEDEAMARIERGRSTRSAVLEPFGQQRNAAASTGDGAEWRFAASPAAVSSSAPADRKLGARVDSAEPPPQADGPMARTSTEDPALAVRSACLAGAGRCDLPRRRGPVRTDAWQVDIAHRRCDCHARLSRCTARLAARLHLMTGRWNIHG